jgi:hypothetical protein
VGVSGEGGQAGVEARGEVGSKAVKGFWVAIAIDGTIPQIELRCISDMQRHVRPREAQPHHDAKTIFMVRGL